MRELAIFHASGPVGDRDRIRVRYRSEEGGPGLEAEADFHFSVDREDQELRRWYLGGFLGGPWGESGPRAEKAALSLDRVGERLFKAVFGHPETRALYEMAAEGLSETRIVVHSPDPGGAALPWELLRDPDREKIGSLACSAYSFTRNHPSVPLMDDRADTQEAAFNILMVISHAGCTALNPQIRSVARPLLEIVRPHKESIRVDVLRPATLERLSSLLGERRGFYHILHLEAPAMSTEGALAGPHQARTNAPECLILEGEGGSLRPVTGRELGGIVAQAGVPLVVLTPPATALDDHGAVFPLLAQQVLRAGVRAVVTVAEPVPFQTIFNFLTGLYERASGSLEVCRAVTSSRQRLKANPSRASPIGDIDLHDWSLPILFQASSFPLLNRSLGALQLNPDALTDQQAAADGEIDCPDPPAHGLVGRDEEILKLDRALRTETVVVLTGTAGIGKTETAAGLARWMAETGVFQGPIFCFRFDRHLPLLRICDRVGETFPPIVWARGEEDWRSLSEIERRASTVRVLKRVPSLMIWDGFESVAGHPPGMPSRWTASERDDLRLFLHDLKGGQTKVLITSRGDEGWLGDVGRTAELLGLKLAEAQRLAVRVLKRAGVSVEKLRQIADYNVLLRFLEGSPLAIQIMVPELRRVEGAELVERLHRYERNGEAALSTDAPGRPLAASLSYRLDSLDARSRKCLALLGLFQGFVDCEVLAALSARENTPEPVRGLGRADWVAILDSVADDGLLRRLGGGRHSIHSALPGFFLKLLGEFDPGTAAALEADFAAVYAAIGLALHDAFERTDRLAMSLIGSEERNLLHAIDLARRHRLAASLEGIRRGLRAIYRSQGRPIEGERIEDEVAMETFES